VQPVLVVRRYFVRLDKNIDVEYDWVAYKKAELVVLFDRVIVHMVACTVVSCLGLLLLGYQ
jgi:hypothetical protein